MKNKKILAIVLSLTLVLSSAGVTAWAVYKNNDDSASGESAQTVSATSSSTDPVTKDETVYVMTTADGQTKKVLVSDWIKNALPQEAQKAVAGLSNAENVKDDCWTGTIEKELPVTMSIRYQLDGKTVSASELAGKSGRVTIRFDYRNNQYEMKTVNGVSQKIYVPFVALTGALLDTDHFSNVSVSNGKLINDGNHIAVIGMAFPGLQNNLSVADLELPDYVEILLYEQAYRRYEPASGWLLLSVRWPMHLAGKLQPAVRWRAAACCRPYSAQRQQRCFE